MAYYMCQVLHVVDFLGSRRMETAPTSIEVLLRLTESQSDEPSDLRGSLSPTSVYGTWQSQAVTHPIINRARRCLTSVIEQKPLSRIPCKVESYNKIPFLEKKLRKNEFASFLKMCKKYVTLQYYVHLNDIAYNNQYCL